MKREYIENVKRMEKSKAPFQVKSKQEYAKIKSFEGQLEQVKKKAFDLSPGHRPF